MRKANKNKQIKVKETNKMLNFGEPGLAHAEGGGALPAVPRNSGVATLPGVEKADRQQVTTELWVPIRSCRRASPKSVCLAWKSIGGFQVHCQDVSRKNIFPFSSL